MNYIGAKFRLLPFLEKTILDVIGTTIKRNTFCDLFAGTGTVGSHFSKLGFDIIANDLEYYSYVINRHKLSPIDERLVQGFLDELNALNGKRGFFFHEYCEGGNKKRQYFSQQNGEKIEAIREKIYHWKTDGTIEEKTFFHLMGILLAAADKVANTASVYGAYLKHIKKTAAAPLFLEMGKRSSPNHSRHIVFHEDANILIQKIEGAILYLDPPYNSRQYGANYHLLNTIAEYQEFEPKGVTGLRDYQKSQYCSKRTVEGSFRQLIENASFSFIFLSYNNEGLMSHETILAIMREYGLVDIFSTDYSRFRADKEANRNHKANSTQEFLFCLRKN